MPVVSVILTSFNHERYLQKAIDSIVNQTVKDIEIIIIDDCSIDSSWDIIKSYEDERIRAFRNEVNVRSGVTYNAIKNISRGKYVAIHHSDDLWASDKLEKQIKFLEDHSEYSACFTNVQLIDEYGHDYEPPEGSFYRDLFKKENRNRFEWLNYFFNFGNCLCHPSLLIRKEAYEKYGLFNYGFGQIPDFLMWIRLCLKSELYIVPEKLTKFRLRNNEQNTSGDRPETRIRSSTEYYFMLREYEKINRPDDFLKVFPEAKKYLVDGEIIPEFALAMICLDTNKPTSYNLFGLELLFNIVNNPEKAKLVYRIYHFTYMKLIQDTGKFDIFSAISTEQHQNTTLYIDIGNGFCEELSLKKSTYLPASGDFSFQFSLDEFFKTVGRRPEILALRFDPNEGLFLRCKIENCKMDGFNCTISPLNSIGNSDGYDIFLTPDPVYLIEGNIKGETITISGNIKILNSYDIANKIVDILETKNRLQSELVMAEQHNQKIQTKVTEAESQLSGLKETIDNINIKYKHAQDQVYLLQNNLNEMGIELGNTKAVKKELENQLKRYKLRLDNLNSELYNTQQELSIIYNSWTWRLRNKVKYLFRRT